MYICDKCKKKYKTLKNKTKKLFPLVDFLLNDAQSEDVCKCGGNIVPLVVCEKCGVEMISEYKLCQKCIDEYKTFDTALDIGEEWIETININGFLASAFSTSDIEQILIETLKHVDSTTTNTKVLRYCNEDEDYFRGYVEKIWNKEKSFI